MSPLLAQLDRFQAFSWRLGCLLYCTGTSSCCESSHTLAGRTQVWGSTTSKKCLCRGYSVSASTRKDHWFQPEYLFLVEKDAGYWHQRLYKRSHIGTHNFPCHQTQAWQESHSALLGHSRQCLQSSGKLLSGLQVLDHYGWSYERRLAGPRASYTASIANTAFLVTCTVTITHGRYSVNYLSAEDVGPSWMAWTVSLRSVFSF